MRQQAVKTLSGGNQQKAVIGKWLLSTPEVLIVDEPTRGVDVGAKFEIYTIIAQLAAEGAGVLFISSELDELMGVCDRILVMSNGEVQAVFARRRVRQGAHPARCFPGAQDAMNNRRTQQFLLQNTPYILFVVVFVIFGLLSPRFFTAQAAETILKQASYIGIVAVGMTFVILTGGIDLSVGSNMYVSAAVAGLLMQNMKAPVWLGLLVCLGVGLLFGAVNGFLITKLKIVPFIATLGTMVAGKGIGLLFSQSIQIPFPDSVLQLGSTRLFGVVPLPIVIFAFVVLIAHLVLDDDADWPAHLCRGQRPRCRQKGRV